MPMLHFRPSNLRIPAEPIWPSVPGTTPATVFTERPPLRKLIVVIENDIAEQASDDLDDELGLLVGLMSHPFVKCLRYADGGPPADVPRHTSPVGDSTPGWVVVEAPYEDGFSYPVVASDEETITQSAIFGDHIRAAESDDANAAYSELAPEQGAKRRRADAMAVQAAFAANADLFITRRPYLHQVTWELASGVLVARPQDALALVALYLRTQGVFDTYRSLDGHAVSSLNRGLFYWVGTRALLPAGWRWFAACRQHAGADTSLAYLAQSTFTRVQRALEARDCVHRALNQPQHNDTAEIALSNLDVVLITLMGALDVTARIAHRALQLPADRERWAAWQDPKWLKAAAASEPSLAELFAPDTWNTTVVRVLSRLRNAVHAAAPAPLGITTPGQGRQATMVSFPHLDGEELAEWMDCLGGRETWGMTSVISGRYHADPGSLLEQLFPAAVSVIDQTMANTPVERLPRVQLTPEDCQPAKRDTFAQWQRTSILRQLALGPPPPGTATEP